MTSRCFIHALHHQATANAKRLPPGEVSERAMALILTNYKALRKEKLTFTQALNLHAMETVRPFLTNDERRALLRVRGRGRGHARHPA